MGPANPATLSAMDPKLQFACLLGAAICFALAAFGRGATGQVALLPLGLLLWLLPTLWNTATLAF